MKKKENIISIFLKHIGNTSVMDLLLKIITCEDQAEGTGTLEVNFYFKKILIIFIVVMYNRFNSNAC